MKKQQVKRTAVKPLILPVGRVITDLVLWDFSQDEDIIRHNANQLARAIQLGYNLEHFGASSFGISEDE
jgi:hypothetical protein